MNSLHSHPGGVYTVSCIFFSHNPKYWCSLLHYIALTTVVANGAIILETKNAESHQVDSLVAGKCKLVEVGHEVQIPSHVSYSPDKGC